MAIAKACKFMSAPHAVSSWKHVKLLVSFSENLPSCKPITHSSESEEVEIVMAGSCLEELAVVAWPYGHVKWWSNYGAKTVRSVLKSCILT